MNNVTLEEIRRMDSQQIFMLLKQYPYESMWVNKDALQHAEYNLCIMQGNRYQLTGNTNSFKTTLLY